MPATSSLFHFDADNLHFNSLVTLAAQNSLLTIIMHYSRVSTPPSRSYSAGTAVLLNELLKGAISLAIACASLSPPQYEPMALTGAKIGSPWSPVRLMHRFRRLGKEVFSPDCWKLSIPAILYGEAPNVLCERQNSNVLQSLKIICSTLLHPT